jgi:hypothetical protein
VKGILIDPVQKSVEYIESDGGFTLGELHEFLGAEALDFCHPFGRTETVVVDDGGMFKALAPFWIEGYGDSPIYGRAVILGRDAGGGDRSTGLTVEEVHELLSFP